jgi:ecdysteroid kinase
MAAATSLITDIAQVTPEWLTGVLQRSGDLDGGQVTAIDVTAAATFTATAIPLRVRYSPAAPPNAPTNLFLKLGRRKSEVDFHNLIAPETKGVPLVRCYEAVFANHLGQSHLLMDDISETHAAPPEGLPLPQAKCERLVDILAGLHAQWWEHPRLAGDLRPVLDDVQGFILGQAQNRFGEFVDLLGDRLSDKRRNWYDRILAALPLPEWKERIASNRQVTLAHGDSHFWNFMFPRQQGEIYLMDWAVWHLDVGPSDLTYMITQLCSPERRARIEQPLVRRYHQQLQANGVGGYDWERCWEDYRLSLVFHAIWPIFWFTFGPNYIWWRGLECFMSAFEDLECQEFL